MRLSIDSLQHLQDYFSSPRASSRCLPLFVSRRRLLGLRRRSFRTPGCRSGIDLDDLEERLRRDATKKSESLAQTKTRWSSDWTCKPTFHSKDVRRLGPHWLHSHAQPARWINFEFFAKACHGKSFYSGFLLFLEQQRAHKYYSLTKIRSVPHFLQPPAIDKEPESNAKMYVNQRRDEMARTWMHILRHEHFRTEYRYVGVFLSNAVFNHFPLEDFLKPKGIDYSVPQDPISVKNSKSTNSPNFSFKGVRAICQFWVFDGNGLLEHRQIDSRWFEKNPPTESGWQRRSKKTPMYRYFVRKRSWRNMCFQAHAISSRLWFTVISH